MPVVRMRRVNPVVLAIQWIGDNYAEISEFAGRFVDKPTTNNNMRLSVYSEIAHDWRYVPYGHYVVRSSAGIYDTASPDELAPEEEPTEKSAADIWSEEH